MLTLLKPDDPIKTQLTIKPRLKTIVEIMVVMYNSANN
jgi:hypothetical protein